MVQIVKKLKYVQTFVQDAELEELKTSALIYV